jgi:hypothetical protein
MGELRRRRKSARFSARCLMRSVAFGPWFTGTAQVNPGFRAHVGQVQRNVGRSLCTLPGVCSYLAAAF